MLAAELAESSVLVGKMRPIFVACGRATTFRLMRREYLLFFPQGSSNSTKGVIAFLFHFPRFKISVSPEYGRENTPTVVMKNPSNGDGSLPANLKRIAEEELGETDDRRRQAVESLRSMLEGK